jgi:SAM-dependent methyltransferase
MTNPWLEIPESDYLGHMESEEVAQLQALGGAFRDVLRSFAPADVLLLGCSCGNGLEHVDPAVTRRVTGIDVNPLYLQSLARRFPSPGYELSLVCADLAGYAFPPGTFDLVHGALVFEYLGWEGLLPGIARCLRPGGVLSVVLQLPSPACPAVTPTRYSSLQALETLFRFVRPEELRQRAGCENLTTEREFTVPLKQGKAFHVMYLRKEDAAP